jgi:hypothetical protein
LYYNKTQSNHVKDKEGSMSSEVWLWILIGIGGMIGGLLYGMREHRLVFPHMEEKHVWNPGFLADILFGLAGGFVIFIIVPGSFDYRSGGWEVIQILALAGVGGYGGRAVVERLLNEQLQALERNVQELRNQDRTDALVIKMLDQHLDDDPDTPEIPVDRLKEAIRSASSSTKVLVFERARQFRKMCTANPSKRHLIHLVIPVFEALIEDDKESKYHRNHAQLAFCLKDKPDPDWSKAEEELTKAIQIRDQQREAGYLAYEFNRAICRIQMGCPTEQILPDLEAALRGEKTKEWIRNPNPERAPGLIQWLQDNRSQIQNWLQAYQIRLPAS